MTGPTMQNGSGTYQVVERHHRCGGAVDLIVSLRKPSGVTTYTAYRWEPDGTWKAFNNAALTAEGAARQAARSGRYALVAADWMKDFLTAALEASEFPSPTADAVAEHADKPAWSPWSAASDPDAFADRAHPDDTPIDEGDND
ncbi:hypothetical protein ABZW49_10820 [Nonomuraea wenchangensis]